MNEKMEREFKILYVDLGFIIISSCDKVAGRVLEWAEEQNSIFLLAPKLIKETAEKEIRNISKSPEKIKIVALPFSNKARNSSMGIIYSYFLRILFSPCILFKKIPKFDIGYSNSPVLVDIIPILLLKLFGKCNHWALMWDSVVPVPSKRSGSAFINRITYWESLIVAFLAKRFASIVFTVNPELKNEIVKRGLDEKKVFLSKNGLFMNRIDKVSGCEESRYGAAFMGRITENKGIYDLLDVWKKIIKISPLSKLAILGTGRKDVVDKFLKAIKENNLEKNIDYLGYVCGDKKYEILKASKIFLFLSKVNADESWGISLMEALACGLPAVTYDLEIYKHIYPEDVLLKSAVGDIDSAAKKTIFLLENKEEYQILSEKAITFARKFDWFEIAREDLDIIKDKL